MEFKINQKTRIKIPKRKLLAIMTPDHTYMSQFRFALQKEAGIRLTSVKYNKIKKDDIYYFRVEDKQKYMLAVIKYGI